MRSESESGGVWGSGLGVEDPVCFWAWTCEMMLMMLPGLEERAMTVVTPAEVARRAATILVDMPPVPREVPAEEMSASRVLMSETTSIGSASGCVRGFLE